MHHTSQVQVLVYSGACNLLAAQRATQYPCDLYVFLEVSPENVPVCHHGLAIPSFSATPCRLGPEGWQHTQWNTGSRAAPSRCQRVLSMTDNPEAVTGQRHEATVL